MPRKKAETPAGEKQGAAPKSKKPNRPLAPVNHENNFEPRDFASALLYYAKLKALRRESERVLREAGTIIKGKSELDYGRDRRFSDPAWRENPIYRRLGQSYLAFCRSLENLVEDDRGDPMRHQKAKLLVDHITSLVAPTNTLLGNPAALKKAYETRGRSLLRGTLNFFSDIRKNKGLPSQVNDSALVVGQDLAVTEGAVVYRNEFLEILQYNPTTSRVYEIPLMVMTPQINKFYFLDLAPGRSFVEYMTSQGYQVFVVSWRNPGPEHAHWKLEDYCAALVQAIDAILIITRAPSVNTMGFCAGGITMSALVSYLNQTGQGEKINVITYAVTLMDYSYPAMIGMMKSNYLLKFSKGSSRVKGLLDGRDLGSVFTMLRPKDLIWDNWVNNYLMGNPAPVFDILSWNHDTTNMPSGLHQDYLNIFNDNLLTLPDGLSILDVPVDLKKITQEAMVVGAITDHLTPWQGCYRTTRMLGGTCQFVLSNSGHVAALVNPPGNPKGFYLTGPKPGEDPDAWQANATRHGGSWWEHWAFWASTRSGKKKRARKTLGNAKYPVLARAPGTYVFAKP